MFSAYLVLIKKSKRRFEQKQKMDEYNLNSVLCCLSFYKIKGIN